MSLAAWAFWGFLGAFVYAAPRFLLVWSEGWKKSLRLAFAEFLVALATGPIGAAGFGPVIAVTIHRTDDASSRAVAIVLGMLANPMAPKVVSLVGGNVMRWLGAPLREKAPE